MNRGTLVVLASGMAVACVTGSAQAGGFYLKEQSAEGLGRAYAGDTALGMDAATVFFNPAAMTALPSAMASAHGYGVFLTAHQEDTGSSRTVPGLPTEVPVTGGDGGNPFAQPVPVFNLYAAAPLNERLWLGFAVNVPFGLEVEYEDDFFGRYDSLKSELTTINLQPSFAYRLSDFLSIGGGIDIQYADAELTNAVPNLDPALPDGHFGVSGDDWSFGWNVGVHLDLDQLRLGLHYRSAVDHNLDGTYTLEGLLGPLAAQNGEVTATAALNLPDIFSAGMVYEFADADTRFLVDVAWYNWSRFQSIDIQGDNGARFVNEQNYKDSWSVSVGGERDIGDNLTVRVGVQRDTTPTQDSHRSTRVPDGDRWWAAVGATLALGERITFTAGYAHVFVSDETINRTDPFFAGTPAQVDTTIRGVTTSNADVVGLSATVMF